MQVPWRTDKFTKVPGEQMSRDRERKLTKQNGYQEEFSDITQRHNLLASTA